MGQVRVIEIHESAFAANDRAADLIREKLKAQKTLFLNFMSSPGSGKTTTLTALINALKGKLKIGEMDVDIESSVDAQRVADATGVESLQIHNGGLCHIDADMVTRALMEYKTEDLDLLILENIGNLVCPAEFDTGAHKNIMILSVPEGDDKPLKYPLMFQVCDIVLINKIDTMEYFNFSMDLAKERILSLNPKAEIYAISGKTGEGIKELADRIIEIRKEVAGE
ncbi:MAG: hydrogenase nickel incorporation protein HypB [Lachnospiraceae bacterium]|nr:hydrogenase nickel incorporation protein HypB [Lachnospiraceae bacterium]